jgi:hypothetical protein
VFVLLASALKLLDVPTLLLGILLLVVALVGLPLWAAVDSAAFPETIWNAAGLDREQWIHRLVMTAPIGWDSSWASSTSERFARSWSALGCPSAACWLRASPHAVDGA